MWHHILQTTNDVRDIGFQITNYENPSNASVYYSSDLHDKAKFEGLERRLSNETDISVTTKSAGLGLDKMDVRFVIDADMPDRLEKFSQHAGEAGRDPNVSVSCILFYRQENKHIRVKHIGEIDNDYVGTKRIQKLSTMINFSMSVTCRHEIIQRYFGYENTEPCRNRCDNCISPPELANNLVITADAKKFIRLISSVTNLVPKPSPELVSKAFSGSCRRDIKKHKLDELELR